ncbi:MAG TPA: hypothetical protein PLA96_13220 [Candidatus Brocadia sapporoensis]|nr:hypothetical protein [Candidatus Brocadia sapporoensis]
MTPPYSSVLEFPFSVRTHHLTLALLPIAACVVFLATITSEKMALQGGQNKSKDR